MKIEALLERKEQLQILILRNLVLQGGTASINGLREHVQLSKTSFDQYLEDIELIGRMIGKKSRSTAKRVSGATCVGRRCEFGKNCFCFYYRKA